MNPIIEKAQIKTQFKRMTLFPTQFTINHSGIQITQITIISTHRTVFTIYIKVTNTITGCFATDDVIITVDPNKPTAQLNVEDVSCFNAKDGAIGFIGVTGGKAPLQYSKDGGATFQSSPNFNNLSGGNYNMVIKDASGCTFLEPVKMSENKNRGANSYKSFLIKGSAFWKG